MKIIIIAILLLIFALLFAASYSLRLGVYVRAVCRLATDERAVALTFDDGCDAVQTPKILEILRRNNIHATFFLIGDKAAQNPDLVRQIVADGHRIGLHTMHHRGTFPLMSTQRVMDELRTERELLEQLSGQRIDLFRPPFGVTNPHIGLAVRRLGLKTIGWSIRSYDTNSRTPREKVVRRIERQLHAGAIILLHDDRPESDQLLEMTIEMLKNNDYKIVSI